MIHSNLQDAQKAIRSYQAAIQALTNSLGVWEENDDSSSPTYIYTKYYDAESDTTKTLCNDFYD